MTIVGVAPRGFNGITLGSDPDVFVPITMRGVDVTGFKDFDNRRSIGRMSSCRVKPGVSREQATVAINGPYQRHHQRRRAPLQKGMSEQTMAALQGQADHHRSRVLAARPVSTRDARAPIPILLVVTGTVLLIACANIANLLLVRGAGRSDGNGGAAVDRRQPPAVDHATADGVDRAGGVRRGRRIVRGEVDPRPDRVDGSGRRAAGWSRSR